MTHDEWLKGCWPLLAAVERACVALGQAPALNHRKEAAAAAKASDALSEHIRAAPGREPADRYRHKKSGGIYEVVAFAERESDQMPLVVYRSLDTLRTWVRPLTEWREKFEYVAAAPPDEPTAGREPAAETALRRVLDVVQRYLPPDGPWRLPEAHEAMSEIIAIVDPWPIAAPSVAREDAQARAQAPEEARDMLDDARLELKMIREALGVPYEPHQSLQERTLEAASRLLPQPNTKEYDALVDAVEKAISVGPMDTIHAGDRHHWDGAWHYEPPPEPRSDHHFLQGRTACAIRAVDAVLRALKEQP